LGAELSHDLRWEVPSRRAVLEAIDVTGTATLLEKLRRPLDPTTVVEPYPEVIEVLTKLRDQGFKMGCVTDNSPDIEHLHEGLGIRHFFEVYAISPVLGCTKPDPRMYHHASNALGLRPEECLFVDDVPQLVAAAIDLGFRGVVVERPGPSPATRVPTVSDLTGILDLLGSHL
jgi:HAD superfamily hydrolase (TIGR01509 family)